MAALRRGPPWWGKGDEGGRDGDQRVSKESHHIRNGNRMGVYACTVGVRARVCVCVCVCGRRKRRREKVCVCVCVCVRVCVRTKYVEVQCLPLQSAPATVHMPF